MKHAIHSKHITFVELRDLCSELGITSVFEYKLKYTARAHEDLVYMPNVTYKKEWVEQGGWDFLFSSIKNQGKPRRTKKISVGSVKSKKNVKTQATMPPVTTSVVEYVEHKNYNAKGRGEDGYWNIKALAKKVRKYNIQTPDVYYKYASLFTD